MSANWPMRRPAPNEGAIRVGRPVSRREWQDLAALSNFLRGKGACLVPECTPSRAIASGSTETFRFRVRTRDTAVQRIWSVGATGAAGSRVSIAGSAYVVTRTTLDRDAPYVFEELLASKTKTEQEISITVAASGGEVTVETISCYEQDRPILNQDSTDYGIDLVTLSAHQPIIDQSYASIGGIMNAYDNLDARRVGILHWTYGDGAWLRTSSTPQTLFGLGVPVLGRKLYTGDTTKSVKWSAYGYSTTAAGTLTMTTSQSSVSDAMTIPVGSAAWTTARTVSISCDNMSADDGRQSSADDLMNFSLASSGTNAVRILSISVWEDT